MINNEARDNTIAQARQQKIVADTLLLQKVNHAHRQAFKQKFPGQIEHCMRLTAERLQAILSKKEATDIADPDTWISTAAEIEQLSHALFHLSHLNQRYPTGEGDA